MLSRLFDAMSIRQPACSSCFSPLSFSPLSLLPVAGPIACDPEFSGPIPVWPLIAIRDFAPDGIIKLQILDGAGPIPIRVIFVVGAMVTVCGIIVRLGLTNCNAAFAQVLPRHGKEHRHALFRDADMVGDRKSTRLPSSH